MPIGKVYNVEWLDQNARRRFPLADDADGVDTTGGFALPTDLILELDLPVHSGLDVEPGQFFIYSILVSSIGLTVTMAYQPTGDDPVIVAVAAVPRSTHVRGKAYNFLGVGDFADTAGVIVIGSLDTLESQPVGLFTFEFAAGRLDPFSVRPMIRGVTGVVVNNGGEESDLLTGDIELVAGSNIRLTATGQQIRIDAISGEGLTDDCECNDGVPANPITSINGVTTLDNNFTLIGTECIQFEPIEGGLRVTDVCAQPCCGYAELERLTAELERLRGESNLLSTYVDRLQNSVTSMELTVLGSRLTDRACNTC